jgi:hypothetical protein
MADWTAPIPVTQHLLLEPQIAQSASASIGASDPLPSYLSESIPAAQDASVPLEGVLPGKRAQPSHLLKFRNKAYGYDTPGPAATVLADMDVDGEEASDSPVAASEKVEEKKEKKKKRKSEGDGPSKKKVKV